MPLQTAKTGPENFEPTFNFKNGRLQSAALDDFYINKTARFINRGVQLGLIFAYFIHTSTLPTNAEFPDYLKFVPVMTWLKVLALMSASVVTLNILVYAWAFFNGKFKARQILMWESGWDLVLAILYGIHFAVILSMQGMCSTKPEFCAPFVWLALWFFLICVSSGVALFLDFKSWFGNSRTAGANDLELGNSFRRAFVRLG